MPDVSPSPDVLRLLFEQLPVPLRFLLGLLSVGLFTLAGYVWKRHQNRVDTMEKQLHSRIDREIGEVNRRLRQQERLLTEIAANTRRG